MVVFAAIYSVLGLTGIHKLPWEIIFIIYFLIFIAVVVDFLLRKTRLNATIRRASTFYLIYQILEIIVILANLHVSSAITFIGIPVVAIYLFIPYFSYTRRSYMWATVMIAIVFYIVVVVLEYSGAFKVPDVYNLGTNVAQNPRVFVLLLTSGVPLIIAIFLLVDFFSQRLRNSLKSLAQTGRELEEEKKTLEVKVNARTEEIEMERADLEKKVKERTKELEEERQELSKRILELERFHKTAVGRELKMRELKKEIAQQKEILKTFKNENLK